MSSRQTEQNREPCRTRYGDVTTGVVSATKIGRIATAVGRYLAAASGQREGALLLGEDRRAVVRGCSGLLAGGGDGSLLLREDDWRAAAASGNELEDCSGTRAAARDRRRARQATGLLRFVTGGRATVGRWSGPSCAPTVGGGGVVAAGGRRPAIPVCGSGVGDLPACAGVRELGSRVRRGKM